ncbi:hypothetical protein M3Y97_00616700 [Aphelenchoides bicaudatus]|nr:hypothetical protein M3Y97_00616700 [Aphelenchoides bicaudatus]
MPVSEGEQGILVLFAILFFLLIAVGLCASAVRSYEKSKMVREIAVKHHMPMRAATALYDVSKSHKKVVHNVKSYSRNGELLDNGRVEALHKHDFYMLQRYMKRLNELKQKAPNISCELESMINEMQEQCGEYRLQPKQRRNIQILLKQPEKTLNKYDDLFLV